MKTEIEKPQAKKRWVPIPAQVAIIWIVLNVAINFFVQPPLPSSIIFMLTVTITVVVLLAYTIFEDTTRGLIDPIVWFLRGDDTLTLPWRAARWAVLVIIPLYVGYGVFQRTMPRFEPPISSRVIHPAPPPEVTAFYNELRDDEANLKGHIEEGARVYYENCHYCHGPKMAGAGHFARAFNPPPSTFNETTIGVLQESFIFWRTATGGPGLPLSATPWDSSMPVWKDFLSDEEMWQVVLYLYDWTGTVPQKLE